MHADPPREPGWPEEHCSLCGRRTNNGIYVDEATARDAAGAARARRSAAARNRT
jgi:hypothetical protein